MHTTTVSVFLDYKCNFACDHCSVGSSPETEFEMPAEILDQFFDDIDEVPSIQQLVFTGGEVTLHKDRLLDALRRADDEGYLTRIVSNGWWAHDIQSAREMVAELVDAGLDEINTSYDDCHTDYVDVDPIANLTQAALESDLEQIAIACIVGDEDPEWNADRLRDAIDERIPQDVTEARDLTIIQDSPAPLGSGAQLDTSNIQALNRLDVGCPDVGQKVSFHPDGSLKACCGHAQFYQPDLTLGNIREDSVPEILGRTQDNLIYLLIHEVGPKPLIEMLDVEDETEYTSICHACDGLLGEHREEFISFVEENRDRLILEEILLSDRVDKQMEILTENREELMDRLDSLEERDVNQGDIERVIQTIEIEG